MISLPCRFRAPLLGAYLLNLGVPVVNASSLLIQGGTLIDGTGKPPIASANILIVDNTISRVWSGAAEQSVPPGTHVLDARGKFVIPGLIDSHTHYNWYMGELFLAHGITTIYDLSGQLDWQNAVQKGLNTGRLRGPLYYHCTTLGGGGGDEPRPGIIPIPMRIGFSLKTPADAKDAVAWVKGRADCITLNENWKGDYFTAVRGFRRVPGCIVAAGGTGLMKIFTSAIGERATGPIFFVTAELVAFIDEMRQMRNGSCQQIDTCVEFGT